jgi:hypothetical protein
MSNSLGDAHQVKKEYGRSALWVGGLGAPSSSEPIEPARPRQFVRCVDPDEGART